MSTRKALPHWVEQKAGYGGAVFAHGVVLGFEKGQWPIRAFAADEAGGCDMAARWASEKPGERITVGPFAVPDDAPVRSARKVPARYEFTEAKP